jgi:hypothetical protein
MATENLKREDLDRWRSKRPLRQTIRWDKKQKGLCVLVSPGPKDQRRATVTFRVAYYLKSAPGKPKYIKLGRYPDETYDYKKEGEDIAARCDDIEAMRAAAYHIRDRANRGFDPRHKETSDAFPTVVAEFIEEQKRRIRTWYETERIFNCYVLPEWKERRIGEIDRDDVKLLLQKIENKKIKGNKKRHNLGGAVMADAVLAQVSKLFSWYAVWNKDFHSPIVRGMRRAPTPKQRARERVLSDDELRALWSAASGLGTYGAAVKCVLLTAQRVRKVGRMRRSQIVTRQDSKTGQPIRNVWDPAENGSRDPENKHVSAVPLPKLASEIIAAVPVIDVENGTDFIFSVNGKRAYRGWAKAKERLDRRMRAALGGQLEPFQLRDLRRTARTLMSRCGIPTEVSEHALGHAMGFVRGTYDRYDYLQEKQKAFAKLADRISEIVATKRPRRGRRA